MSTPLERFLSASKTGKEVLILKSTGDCDCFDENDLVNSEPDPRCTVCFGTGKKRRFVISDKIRYDLNADKAGGDAQGTKKTETNDSYSFFFPSEYRAVSGDDLICTFNLDNNVEKMFEVTNKFEFIYNDFSYIETYARKIQFVYGFGEINERVK